MTTAVLCLLRSLESRSIETGLVPIFLTRCGATAADYDDLKTAGHVRERAGRTEITDDGRRAYRKAKVGRYF